MSSSLQTLLRIFIRITDLKNKPMVISDDPTKSRLLSPQGREFCGRAKVHENASSPADTFWRRHDRRGKGQRVAGPARRRSSSSHETERPGFRFQIEGRRFYPRFQFDPENHRIHPWFVQILRAAQAAGWDKFRILNWMMRPHLDFNETPATSLADKGEEVLLAFLKEIVPEDDG